MRFDLTDLRLFLHVAEAASITQGASRANMALASASERIRGMEDTLGIPLLERKRRGIELTQAGTALACRARIVLHQVEEMHGEMNNFARGLKCHVHVLANTVAMVEFLPPALAGFLSVNPNVHVDLEERQSGDIIRAVSEGLADIGVVAEFIDPAEDLESFPFAEDRLVVITPSGHALRHRREVAFSEILDYEFVGLAPGSALQKTLYHHAARSGRRLKLRVQFNSFESIARMVEGGFGIAVLPESTARRCQRSMALRIIDLSEAWASRHFTLCIRKSWAQPAHAKQLLDHLVRHAPSARRPTHG